MPSTIVRSRPRGRGPFTFVGLSSFFLEREDRRTLAPETKPKCVALQDDGSACGLPARYIDMNKGHVCFEHRPDRKKEVLQLV